MTLQVVGWSHHKTPIVLRERLAFNAERACEALDRFVEAFPQVEVVLLSTCNRIEFYTASEARGGASAPEIVEFVAQFHGLDKKLLLAEHYQRRGLMAVRHLFAVTASLDSMVVGESQILSQVKQAYQLATGQQSTGPFTHAAFQAALRVARRVAGETALHQHRVSVPSVAVADFAKQVFERFDDKNILIVGAGEMADETFHYLRDEGARDVTVVNRSDRRAAELARRWQGRAVPWERLLGALAEADLVVSTTGAEEPILAAARFSEVAGARTRWPLVVLDLAVPRDFDPAIGLERGVYLYSIDDLESACQRNLLNRNKEMPEAIGIIAEEAELLMGQIHHMATGPLIRRLREGWEKPKEEELRRLWNKLPDLNDDARDEIRHAFDRLVNKLLHPPLESIRDESRHGIPSALLDALTRLFQLKD